MSLLETSALNILNTALAATIGIEIKVVAPDGMNSPALRAKQILYRFKNENPAYAHIQIRLSPHNPETHLWLINQHEQEQEEPKTWPL